MSRWYLSIETDNQYVDERMGGKICFNAHGGGHTDDVGDCGCPEGELEAFESVGMRRSGLHAAGSRVSEQTPTVR